MEWNPNGKPYPNEEVSLPLSELQEKRKDLRKELHIYLRVLPMQNAVRQTLIELLDEWESTAFYIGYRRAELDQTLDRRVE